jgi:hypothetical protein
MVISPAFARLLLQMHIITVIAIAITVMGMHIPSTIGMTLLGELTL